jgi:hypothetical protein
VDTGRRFRGCAVAERVGAGSTAWLWRGMDGLDMRGGYGGGSVTRVGQTGMARGCGRQWWQQQGTSGAHRLARLEAGLAGFGRQDGLVELGWDGGI